MIIKIIEQAMNKSHPKFDMASIFGILGIIGTILSSVVYVTWKASTLDKDYEKRISVLEANQVIYNQKIIEFKQGLDDANNQQDQNLIRLQNQINSSLNRVEDKIEKIYLVISSPR